MPLPVSHSLAGATLWALLDRDAASRPLPAGARWRLGLAVLLANAPDLDLLPGMLAGEPNRYHHGASHSLAAALAFGLLAAALAARRGWVWPSSLARPGPVAATALIVAALLLSHVGLDLLTYDPSPPVGIPLAWPVTPARVHGPPLFARGDKLAGAARPLEFLASIASRHNARAAARELLLLGPLFAAALIWRRRRLT